MADKQVTVPVPEDRVAEFYAWFASFLASDPDAGRGPWRRGPGGPGRRGGPGRHQHDLEVWSGSDGDRAAWLYERLAPGARELFDLLASSPGTRFSGNDVAARLKLDKGAHGVAGILAWPGRYSRRLDRALPIATEGRPDGGTDYFMGPEVAALFSAIGETARLSTDGDHPEPPSQAEGAASSA
ncbi:MAG TPA: DUF6416 domain-containing protein [Solirubrobacteraceae bacterium]